LLESEFAEFENWKTDMDWGLFW